MADDSDFDWAEFGEALLEGALEIGLNMVVNEATNALMGRGKAAAQSSQYAVKQPVPPAIRLVGGYACVAPAYVFYESLGNCIASVQAINAGRIDSIERIFLNEDVVTLGGDGRVITVNGSGNGPYMDDPNPRVTIFFRMGLATETPYEPITSRWGSIWTSNHRGDGVASVAMLCFAPQAKFFKEAFPNGRPELRVAARGVFYDWRKDSTAGGSGSQRRNNEATWGPCDNPVVVYVHKEWAEYGRDWATSIAPVLAALTVEADYCDEMVETVAGEEKRYRCAFSHRADEARDSVLNKITATMAGWSTEDEAGCLVLQAGRYYEPTVTLTAADIVGGRWQVGTPTESRPDRFNVSFISADANYAQADCDPWIISETGDTAEDFFAEGCPSFSQARRLAKIAAAKRVPPSSGNLVVNTDAVWGERYVAIDYPERPELDGIVIEIADGVEMDGVDGYSFSAIQVSPSMYAWNPETEEGADPGSVTRPPYEPLSAPVITESPAPELVVDGYGVRISMEVTGPDRDDLTWTKSWRLSGDTTWTETTDTSVTGGTVTLIVGPVPADEMVEVSATYRTGSGASSPRSDAVEVDTTTP